jgi:hypothetical protein
MPGKLAGVFLPLSPTKSVLRNKTQVGMAVLCTLCELPCINNTVKLTVFSTEFVHVFHMVIEINSGYFL